jgi:hypothetical protein
MYIFGVWYKASGHRRQMGRMLMPWVKSSLPIIDVDDCWSDPICPGWIEKELSKNFMSASTIQVDTASGPVIGLLELKGPFLGISLNGYWYSFDYLNSRWRFMPATQEWGIPFDEAEAHKELPCAGIIKLDAGVDSNPRRPDS